MKELIEIVQTLTAPSFTGGVLATLVAVAGSSYRRPGARLVVDSAGRKTGSISGGCLEEDVVARAHVVADSGRPELVTYDTTSENDLVWGVGLGCHGVVQVLLEPVAATQEWAREVSIALSTRQPIELAVVWRDAPAERYGTRLSSSAPGDNVFRQLIQPPLALTIFGAGDDARPLVDFATALGWHICVADPRPNQATAARFPCASRLVVAPAAELVDQVKPEPGSVAVVMTHHYVHDVPVLRALAHLPLGYIGLLGPKQRAERILADLARDGIRLSEDMLSRFHAPVGLDLGANTPDEVALSIVAEIQACIADRDGRPLRLRTKPIHA